MGYLAHLDENKREHTLEDHLFSVRDIANRIGEKFVGGTVAALAGKWHDLGKYSRDFQNMILEANGLLISDQDDPVKKRVNHSSAGALWAVEKLPKLYGEIMAFLIAGHHAGLADKEAEEPQKRNLVFRLQDKSHLESLPDNIPDDILSVEELPNLKEVAKQVGPDGLHLWIRMLFSCLIDADRLDTEEFFNPGKAKIRGNYPTTEELLPSLDQHIESMLKEVPEEVRATKTFSARQNLLQDCREKATYKPGFFSINAPTGAGKTLSSMAFALGHCKEYNKERVIYVAPFTAIIEQTTNTFKKVFGESNVVEHHSNIDPGEVSYAAKLATENWDAPIISTTTVQLFESLYANKTNACRKLHNLVNSVIILDEVQKLPLEYLRPIMSSLKSLVNNYGCTVVLCSATQPDFTRFDIGEVQEIVSDPENLHESLKRVDISPKLININDWSELVGQIKSDKSALIIVDKRQDCRDLHSLMPGAYHLSTWMCGEHRSRLISEIKERLSQGEPIKVVSTQVVEAGVDLDFDVCYRNIAGIDSVVQAAGRVNREGRKESGELILFRKPDSLPPGQLRQAANITQANLAKAGEECFSLEGHKNFFRELFEKYKTSLDKKNILKTLKPNVLNFETAAKNFTLINSTDIPIIVPYGDGKDLIKTLLTEEELDNKILRRLQRYSVGVSKKIKNELLGEDHIKPVFIPQDVDPDEHEGLHVLLTEEIYTDIGIAVASG